MLASAQGSSGIQVRYGATDDHLAILLRPSAQSRLSFKAHSQKVQQLYISSAGSENLISALSQLGLAGLLLRLALQVWFKRCRPITKATSEPQETSAKLLSRRQALLLGAGSLAASNIASPSSAIAETPEVAAVGIKSAETVQLGQSGMSQQDEHALTLRQ